MPSGQTGSLKGTGESHLVEEFDRPVEAEGLVAEIGIKVDFGGDAATAELPVDKRRSVWGIRVEAPVLHAYGARRRVELEHGRNSDVRTVTFAGRPGAGLAVGRDIGRGVEDGPGYVARDFILLVDGFVGRSLGIGRKKKAQVGPGGHADDTDLVGVEAALLRFASDQPYGSLAVFPGALVDGKAFRPGRAVEKPDTLETEGRELLRPDFSDVPDVRQVVVASSGDQDYASSVRLFRSVQPFDIWGPVLLGLEIRLGTFIPEGGYLVVLRVGHFAFRPEVYALDGAG